MLTLPKSIADAVNEHAERDYPNECCGVLLGSFSEEQLQPTAAIPAGPAPMTVHAYGAMHHI